ncbi:MAG: hypothetical protein KGL39_50235 [Patescibacteria group bacterium]|nr:hypothetical protein [Patescibacteria group bacterium]
MTPAETRAALEEAMAKALHADDVAQANREREAQQLPPVSNWADPWQPSGIRQLETLRRRAQTVLAEFAPHLAELGLKIVPVEATEKAECAGVRAWVAGFDTNATKGQTMAAIYTAMLAAFPNVLGGSDAQT